MYGLLSPRRRIEQSLKVGILVTNEQIDNFIGERVKVTLQSGRVREGHLKRSDNDARVLVRGLGYDLPRSAILKIEPLA